MNWVLLAPTMSEFSGSTLVSEARVLWSDSFKDEFVQDIVDLISLSIDHEFGSVDGLGCLVAAGRLDAQRELVRGNRVEAVSPRP